MMLHSNSQKFLERLKRYRAKTLAEMTPAEARVYVAGQSKLSHKKPSCAIKVTDIILTHEETHTPLRFYRPLEGEDPPLILYFHGGGFVTGDLNYSDQLCQRLCEHLQALVVNVDYHLAPEYPFPFAVQEGLHILKTLLAHPHEYRFDATHVTLMGDSAGANIAAVITNLARESVHALVLLYPVTDFAGSHASQTEFGEGFFLTKANTDWARGHYLQDLDKAKDPLASPLLDMHLKGLPKTLIIAAECDPLRDEARAYAKHLIGFGNEVHYVEFKGMVHCFATLVDFFPEQVDKVLDLC